MYTEEPIRSIGEDRWRSVVAGLRARHPAFAEASLLYPEYMREWQGAVYLLSGCRALWSALGNAVCAERSIFPVIDELGGQGLPWSDSEIEILEWAAHFWDVDGNPAHFPYRLEEFYFHRWIVACQLRSGMAIEVRA